MDKLQASIRESRAEKIYGAIAIVLAALIPLSLTFTLWDRERSRVELEARTEFESRARETAEAIRARMLNYEQVLRGAAALFATSDTVTRSDWREYVRLVQTTRNFPGIAGVAYAPVVTAEGLNEFVTRVRQSEISNYRVWPEGVRPFYLPTLYIEPFDNPNLRALGFDAYSEPVRRAALERARDGGEATLSARITLAQDSAGEAQAGVVMYVPVYRRGTDPATLEQRRTALAGFVTGGFRVDDLLKGILGNRFPLDMQIYDGPHSATAQPLVQKRPSTAAAPGGGKFMLETDLYLNFRHWTLSFSSTPEFERIFDNDRPRLILTGGLLISGLLIVLIWSLASTRNQAVKLARGMTAELSAKQDALAKSEERISLALQGSDLALFDWDIASGVVQLSERWAAMLGRIPRTTTATATELSQLVHSDDMPHLQKELRALMRGESASYNVEHRVRTVHGNWLWVMSRAKVVERDAGGRALRVAGTNADISVRKAVERMKGEFVGTVSHELRTPLTVIVGSLGLLRAELEALTPDQKMMFDMACENSVRLQMLVNDILDFEKIASGATQFNLQRVQLGPFLHRALELNRVYADRLQVRYELRGPLPPGSLLADAERLMQVMTNLLSNAAKFSPEGAAVTICASVAGEWGRVTVTDCGPGVPTEFRDRIFGQFAQADASDTRQRGGTGLGLSICKAIVEKLGGRIGFESEPGKGATFYFELPYAAPLEEPGNRHIA